MAREEAGGEASEILVVQTLGAIPPGRGRRRRRKAAAADPEGEIEIPVTRLTVVKPWRMSDDEASGWLDRVGADSDAREQEIASALRLVNRALHAQGAASGDPYVPQVSTDHALALRLGYGSGDEVAEGRWAEVREVPAAPPPRRRRRAEELRPQELVAAVLSGRERIDICEAPIARAVIDLDAGRIREAALQLRVGLEAILVELRGAMADPGHEEDMAVLETRRHEAGEAANAALRGDLDAETADNVRELVETSARVLRRRRVLRG